MTETITLLRHPTANIAKVWQLDGSITPYADAKHFTLREYPVGGMAELSSLLTKIERDPRRCIIRGGFAGEEASRRLDDEWKEGKVRRLADLFPDRPLHSLMIDVDGFEPILADPMTDPAGAVEEYILTCLPAPFHNRTHHWQLSNSAGRSGSEHLLKAHVWFWLRDPLSGAQLTSWAKEEGVPLDIAVFRSNQVHYTSNPIFAEGVVDPVAVRSGLVSGREGDEVPLVLSDAAMAADGAAGGRSERLADIREDDLVGLHLSKMGYVLSTRRDGGLNITCPFEGGHSGPSGETSTVYYPAFTGGFSKRAFKCLHASCAERHTENYLEAIGYNTLSEIASELADVSVNAGPGGLYEQDNEVHQLGVPDAQHLCSQQANAERLVEHFGSLLLVTADRWHGWDGKRWVQDDGRAYRAACTLSRIIGAEADKIEAKMAEADEDTAKALDKAAKALRAWGKASEMTSNIDGTLKLVKKLMAVDESEMDKSPWLLNCLNGTVDLRTGKLLPHNPRHFITKLVRVEYDPKVRSPLWEDTVRKVTIEYGQKDAPVADFLQRWFGYCATGETREQKFVVHYGLGANGKSTILDTISEVLNDYAGTAAPGLLMSKGNERHPTEIADLFGRRMVTAQESSEGGVLREDFVKQATGGDRLKARYMRADFFEFAPTHKLQMLTNHKPVIKGQDGGIWRRVLLVPYRARFGSTEDVKAGRATWVRDTRTVELLKGELMGVLTWIVEGARLWHERGLMPPDVISAASREYQSEQDRVKQFCDEMCEMGAGLEVPLTDAFGGLYQAYQSWCKDGGMYALSKVKLCQELERVVPFYDKIERKTGGDEGRRKKLTIIKGLTTLG